MNINLVKIKEELELIIVGYLSKKSELKACLLLEERLNIHLHGKNKQSALDMDCNFIAAVCSEVMGAGQVDTLSNEIKSDVLADSKRYLRNFDNMKNYPKYRFYFERIIKRLINDYLALGGMTQPIFKQFKQESSKRIRNRSF